MISKIMKIRKIGGKSVGFSLYKDFLNKLKWGHGDYLRGYVEGEKLIIELFKKKNND